MLGGGGGWVVGRKGEGEGGGKGERERKCTSVTNCGTNKCCDMALEIIRLEFLHIFCHLASS